MNIIRLEAENFKRLRAVTITPSGNVVTITGKNGQGKSSVLDSIWAALGGAAALPKVPVRAGAEDGHVTVDLGAYKITRKFKVKEDGDYSTSLVIENPDGMRAKSPQTLLDEIVGKMTMDPMAFSRMTSKEQFDSLKVLVPGLDLDDIAAKDAEDYERRTAANRKAKEAKSAAAAIGAKDGRVQKIDTAKMMEKLSSASEVNAGIEERRKRREAATKEVADIRKAVSDLYDEQQRLEARLKEIAELTVTMTEKAERLEIRLRNAEPLPEPVDTAELTKAISEANAANGEAEKQERRDSLLEEAARWETQANALTAAMEARAEHKRAMIAAAKFPVEGLSLGDGEVLVDGLPFDQAATSKKIRTSMAIAMAANPTVRVIRIIDGSLLDEDAMKLVADMARDHDFQVWIEVVSDGEGTGILIEDGHVKGQ